MHGAPGPGQVRPGLGRDQGGFTGSAEISFHSFGLCLFLEIVFIFFPVAENVLSKVLRGALLDGSVWCSRREEAARGTQSVRNSLVSAVVLFQTEQLRTIFAY